MGALLQKLLLKVLPQGKESSEGQHVTDLGCCSTILKDENTRHDEEDISSEEEDDPSHMDR